MSDPIDPLRERQQEEDAAYEAALAALDRLGSFPLPAENLRDLPAQLEAINRLWEAPAVEASSGLMGQIDGRARQALAPVIERQQEFNANLVRILNGTIAEEAKVAAHFREVAAALVRYAQRLLPTVDARDRLATAHATLRAELILDAFARRLESLHRRIDGLRALADRVDALGTEVAALKGALERAAPPPEVARAALAAAGDSAYVAFENRFRGDEAGLRARFRGYAERLRAHAPVVDLGCGRGEFLRALREIGVGARGVESNASNVEICRKDGLDVVRGDLVDFLSAAPDGSLGAVFAAQVAEHLPPAVLTALLRESRRALRADGVLILETVNPRSVTGFLEVYNRDLTHERPLHPETLSFLAAAAGFTDVRVEMLSAVDPLAQLQRLTPSHEVPERVVAAFNENVDRLNAFLYGPMEYALIATRA